MPPDHPFIRFTGPTAWSKDPSIQVIRRTRRSNRKGEVDQLFAINERGDGLGRVSDTRAGSVRGSMDECFKFPLGVWQQGETRKCRASTITILEIDYVYERLPHALKFRWTNGGTYIFSPDRGMVATLHGD